MQHRYVKLVSFDSLVETGRTHRRAQAPAARVAVRGSKRANCNVSLNKGAIVYG